MVKWLPRLEQALSGGRAPLPCPAPVPLWRDLPDDLRAGPMKRAAAAPDSQPPLRRRLGLVLPKARRLGLLLPKRRLGLLLPKRRLGLLLPKARRLGHLFPGFSSEGDEQKVEVEEPQKVEDQEDDNGHKPIPCYYVGNACREGSCRIVAVAMTWATAKNASPRKRAMCLACAEWKVAEGFTDIFSVDEYDVHDISDMKVLEVQMAVLEVWEAEAIRRGPL